MSRVPQTQESVNEYVMGPDTRTLEGGYRVSPNTTTTIETIPPADSGISSLQNGEVTNTVLIGAFLAIVGNNLLKPLFRLIIKNFESDQKATEDVVNILKDRIAKLEVVNDKQSQEHTRYLTSLDVANTQASNIARILEGQSQHVAEMADSIKQLSLEVSSHRLEVQKQIDNLAQHVYAISHPEPQTRAPVLRKRNNG